MLINALNQYVKGTEHGPAVVDTYPSGRGVVIVRVLSSSSTEALVLAHTYLSSENARALAQELVKTADKAGPSKPKTKAERIREVIKRSTYGDSVTLRSAHDRIQSILDEEGDL